MFSPHTFIVEMTGIFGAGYVPGLFQPLTRLLRDEHLISNREGAKQIVTRYHVDNTAALKEDEQKQKRATKLIKKADAATSDISESEWQELTTLLSESERRFINDVASYHRPIDIAFRRGGRLQDYILLHEVPNRIEEIERDPRSQPKLQFFLRADIETITESYQDEYFQQLLRENPDVYNATPEKAFRQQEAWLERVEHFTGLHYIDREHVLKPRYARQIVEDIAPFLRPFGMHITRHNAPKDFFLCHAWEDKEDFVRPLARTLTKLGARVWYDEFELTVGDSLGGEIDKGLAASKYGVVVLSEALLDKRSTGWIEEELKGLFARQTTTGQMILPIWYGITKADLLEVSPSLAGTFALNANALSIEEIAERLHRKLKSYQEQA